MRQKKLVIYYILISSIFIFLLIILNVYSSSNIVTVINRLYITLIFILICFFGFTLSFYPRWYLKIIKTYKKSNIFTKISNKSRVREGHHPNCIKFKNHVIKIKNKKYCAGCFGLGLGSIISIFLIIYYYIFYNNEYQFLYQYYFFLGISIVVLSFFETFINSKPIIHLSSNIFLIIGFLMIVISTFENSCELIYGLIAIMGSFLFLETRIQISLLNHRNICLNCNKTCKMY